jgi:hypothetical protein
MKLPVYMLIIVSMAVACYAAFDVCQWTVNTPCHSACNVTYDCSTNPPCNFHHRVDTAGQSYNHCSMIGLGSGNTGCQNSGNPFCCSWDIYYTECGGDDTVFHLVGGGACGDPPLQPFIQPTTASGGSDCS